MKRLAPLLIALAAAGCTSRGGSTPQELFEKSQAAANARDWGAYFDLVHPGDVDIALFHYTYIASLGGMNDEAKAKDFSEFMKRHGVPERKPGEKLDMSTPELLRSTVKELFKDVKDKRAFFLDTMKLLDANAKAPEGGAKPVDATLKDVKEEGDVARGTIAVGGQGAPFLARKLEGRWMIGFER